MSEWKTMDTAPKGPDAPYVLLYYPGPFGCGEIVIAFWAAPMGHREGYWCVALDQDGQFSDQQPTHWMPLPEPPP